MSEVASLHEYVTAAIHTFLQKSGGGIPDGFTYAVKYIDSDGASNTQLGTMEGQSPVLTAGLVQYLQVASDSWVADAIFGDCDCEDEGVE